MSSYIGYLLNTAGVICLSYGRHCTSTKFSDSASRAWDCGSLWFHSCAAPDLYVKSRKVWSRFGIVML